MPYSKGRGGWGSRRGSGRGSNRTTKAKPQAEKKKKALEDYVFKTNQSGECKETLKYLLNHIRQKYSFGYDIATALTEDKEHDFDASQERPKKTVIPEVDANGVNEKEKQEANEQRKAEEKVAKLIFNKEVEEFVKRKIAYKYLFF